MTKDRKSSSMTRMMTVLTVVCLLSGIILAAFHSLTAQPIADAMQRARVDAITMILPEFNNNPLEQQKVISLPGQSRPFNVYPAYENGRFTGAAVESYSMDGFSGEITVIYGFDADGNVSGYHIMSHAETPGLGAKMEEWFRMDEGHRSVIGLNPSTSDMTVSKDGGDIDGITAATISSRAFLKALSTAFEAFELYRKQENIQGQ